MERFEADYFDGRSSARHRVEVVVHAGRAVIRGPGVALEFDAPELRVQPRVGGTPWRIVLPGGAVLVTQSQVVEEMLAVPRATGLAHRLESHLGFVLAAFLGLVVAGWFGYRDGIPWLAREVAHRVPPALESDIAAEGMATLDRHMFKPSKLDPQRQARLREIFAQLAAGSEVPAQLEFRDGDFLGANAFALPGGTVVMTDQLAALIEDDERVAAVLAHEVGHLVHRHGVRHILQDSITALVAAAVLGDATSVGSLAATLPALVMHTSNSREFEREADTFAFELLRKTGRSPRLLGEALAALEKQRDEGEGGGCPVPLERQEGEAPAPAPEPEPRRRSAELGYLSTHPPTQERIRAAEAAAR